MAQKIVAANWKMNKTIPESHSFCVELAKKLLKISHTEVILCPPFTSLFHIKDPLQKTTVALGGQNMHYELSGAYTGEISAPMLKSAACQYVILGHSERRHIFGESDKLIKKKIDTALSNQLQPIICIGEKIDERKAEQTTQVIQAQLRSALENITQEQATRCIIAYEPVWAIGTGLTASPPQASEAHQFIRDFIGQQYNQETADQIPVLYGGSVKEANADKLIIADEIDGFLVGGASLEVDHFVAIINTVEAYLKKQE